MAWLVPSVIATLSGSLTLAFVYEFLYEQDRKPYLRTWMWGWMIYAGRYALQLIIASYHQTPLLFTGNQWLSLLSGVFLLRGTYQFIGRDIPRVWWISTLVGMGWILVAAYAQVPFMVATLPTFTFLAWVYVWTGSIFLKQTSHTGQGYRLVGWTFMLWGIHKADYPALRPVTWFAPWGYLLAAVFELVAAFGMLLTHFDKIRRDMNESQSTLVAFANALPDLGLIMDQDGVYVEILTSQEYLLAANSETLCGSRMHDILPQDVADLILGAILSTLETGKNHVIEYVLEVPAGRRWFEGHLARMRVTGPKRGEVVLIARDITQHKEWQKSLHQSTEELIKLHQQVQDYAQTLEERVKARTEKLNETNRYLEELARTKDEFVANVSHELRSPITSLKLRQYLLDRHPDQVSEHLPVMERETLRLEHTIEDLLTLSRMDQGRMQLNIKPVDLNGLAEVYYFDRMPLAREQGLDLHLRCAADLPLIQADDGLLSQVINILLSNALSYTPPGGDVIISTHRSQFDDQEWVGLSVSDTGLGITRDELKQLFGRFYRGKAARQSKAPGTGLGLSIAQVIIEKHQGRIDVHSDGVPGEGATFTIWLLPDTDTDDHDETKKRADAGRVGTSAHEVGGVEASNMPGHTQSWVPPATQGRSGT